MERLRKGDEHTVFGKAVLDRLEELYREETLGKPYDIGRINYNGIDISGPALYEFRAVHAFNLDTIVIDSGCHAGEELTRHINDLFVDLYEVDLFDTVVFEHLSDHPAVSAADYDHFPRIWMGVQ